jgi:hypothetical protein
MLITALPCTTHGYGPGAGAAGSVASVSVPTPFILKVFVIVVGISEKLVCKLAVGAERVEGAGPRWRLRIRLPGTRKRSARNRKSGSSSSPGG